MPKNASEFYCEKCEFICYKKSNYTKHLLTRKHVNDNKINESDAEKCHVCDVCNKQFKDRSGLWRHKKKTCTAQTQPGTEVSMPVPPQIDPNLIIELLKENKELREMMIEQNKQVIDLAPGEGSKGGKGACRYYPSGTCWRGSKCPWAHEGKPGDPPSQVPSFIGGTFPTLKFPQKVRGVGGRLLILFRLDLSCCTVVLAHCHVLCLRPADDHVSTAL